MATVEHRPRPVENVAGPPADEARARLECLYREHVERVFAICGSVLRDRHEAEDAAQQVFVSALRALLRGAEPRDPGAWLATIARNESWARARRQQGVPLVPELRDVAQEDPSTVVVRRSELARIWQAIEGLPASQREALLLREVRGLGYDELAADLQVSHPSVRSLLNRARRTLRTQLEKGAAALTGAPWLTVLARFFGDASSPALSSASRSAAVGLGVLAIAGGAVVSPSLDEHAQRRPAAHGSTPRGISSTHPPGRVAPEPARETVAVRSKPSELHRRPRDDHRSARGSGLDDPRGSDAAPSGDGSGAGGGSDSRGRPGAASDGDGSTSGTDDGAGEESRSGDEVARTTPGGDASGSSSEGESFGPSASGDTGSSGDTRVLSTSSHDGDSSRTSGGSASDGDDGGGGSGGSSGSDGGSGESGSSGSGS